MYVTYVEGYDTSIINVNFLTLLFSKLFAYACMDRAFELVDTGHVLHLLKLVWLLFTEIHHGIFLLLAFDCAC